MNDAPDLLASGIYSVPEAAFLVGASERRVRGWLEGYAGSRKGPLIENEIGWSDKRLALSFRNLLELRFIAFFERQGVKFNKIRRIMEEVSEIAATPHPFATNIVFRTDGRKIVAEIINAQSGLHIYDLESHNYEIVEFVYSTLKEDVEFDFNGEAKYWIPRKSIAPNVIVHPRFAFGKPIVRRSRIPTRTLSEAFEVEGSAPLVAEAFECTPAEVREAVRFEANLRKAA